MKRIMVYLLKTSFEPSTLTPERKLDKKDIIICSVLTLIFLSAALINLGSLHIPKTGWKPVKPGEMFQVDLGEIRNLSKIYFYEGTGYGRYRLEYQKEDGNYHPLGIIKKNDFYKWKYLNVFAKTDNIKIITDVPGGTLLELLFFLQDTQEPIKGINILDKYVDPLEKESVEKLFDEQETVEYRPSFMTGTYFDEIYYARTAYEHLHRIEPYETTHPPLGKILIALGITVFGMNPFGWRIIGIFFGTAMIPFMYLFGKKLFGGRFFPFCAAFLLTFDFMHFTQSRIATIDVYAVFFILLMFYYIHDYFIVKAHIRRYKKSLYSLFLSGFFFGLGVATKWISLYGAVGLAILFFWAEFPEPATYSSRARVVLGRKKTRNFQESSWVKNFWRLYIGRTILYGFPFFILIPAAIYLLSYLPFMMVPGPGHGIKEVLTYQTHMYNYHSKLVATHPFSSTWWEWPLITRPIWLYGKNNLLQGTASSIVSMGNPAVWWIGIVAVIPALIIAVRRREKRMAVVFVAIISQYLPWIFVKRLTFIYHFFSIVPFLILSVVYLLKVLSIKYAAFKYGVYFYLGMVVFLFILFYPVLSGMEVPLAYVRNLKWFKGWIF